MNHEKNIYYEFSTSPSSTSPTPNTLCLCQPIYRHIQYRWGMSLINPASREVLGVETSIRVRDHLKLSCLVHFFIYPASSTSNISFHFLNHPTVGPTETNLHIASRPRITFYLLGNFSSFVVGATSSCIITAFSNFICTAEDVLVFIIFMKSMRRKSCVFRAALQYYSVASLPEKSRNENDAPD